MPLTNRDAQDAALNGALQFQEWAQEWTMQWMMPELQILQAQSDEQMVAVWDQMPDAMKEQFRQVDLETYARAEKSIAAMRERLNVTKSTGYSAGAD